MMRINTFLAPFITIFFTCVIQNTSIAQGKPVYFDRYYTGVGLSDNITEHVIEDNYGFLWITTGNGLNRFNGNSFRIYLHDKNDSTSIPHNNQYGIFEDSKKRLWVGTHSGVALYNRKHDNFRTIDIFKNNEPANKVTLVWNIKEDSKGTIWFCTVNGICSFDEQHNTFSWDLSKKFNLASAVILDCTFDDDDNLWLATERKGILRIDARTGNLTEYNTTSKEHRITNNNIRCIIEDKYRRIWAGTLDSGICMIDPNKNQITRYGVKNGLITPFITSLYENKNGIIWASCINGGLMYFNTVENKFVLFNIKSSDKNEVGLKSISSVYEDSNGIIWITGRQSGLLSLNPHKNRFVSYKCVPDGSGLNAPVVTSFYEGKDGRIWIGTDGGGVNILELGSKKFTYLDHAKGLASDAVLDIEPIEEQTLWVATWGGGLNEINTQTMTCRRLFNNENDPDHDIAPNLKCIYNDDTLVWFGTYGYGIQVYDKKRHTIIKNENNRTFNFSMIQPKWTNCIIKDTKKRYWICSSYGLHMYQDTTFKTFLYNGEPGSINGNTIIQAYEDAMGRIWIVSDAGLNLYDEKHDNFIDINEKVGNFPKKFFSISSDFNGNLWIGSNAGLVKYDPKNNLSKIFTESEGIQGEIFFENAAMRTSKGELFFGGLNGFNRNNPLATRVLQKLPRIYITNLYTYNPTAKKDNELFVNTPIFGHDTITIHYDQSIFTLEYSGVYLLSPKDIVYKYKLEGFNKSWIMNTEPKTTFTNLDPGTYTFYVTALTRDGAWAMEADSVTIIITPPWWDTLIFKFFCIVISILSVLIVYKYRVMRIKRENRILEQKVTERTLDLDIKNKEIIKQGEEIKDQLEMLELQNKELVDLNYTKDKFLSIISHDLKNPMATVIGFSELLIMNLEKFQNEKIRSYLKLIHDSSQNIHDLLKNLLDWSRSQMGHITYNPQPINLSLLGTETKYFLDEMAMNKQITIQVDCQAQVMVMADKNMIEAVIRNLINNSIKYTHPDGTITVCITASDSRGHVTISDTGVGMDDVMISKLFKLGVKSNTKGTNNETGTGLGLIICKEFLRYHGSEISVESAVNKGSRFSFSLPLAPPVAR